MRPPSLWATALATLSTLLLVPLSGAGAFSPSDIPADTPVNQLIASAKSALGSGAANDAITYYDAAVARDPSNYLTVFQRGATYLSLGRANKAADDFDRVLTLRPTFEGALLQRAKLRARDALWEAARDDYTKAGRKAGSPEWDELVEAEGAARLAGEAEKAGDWEKCVGHAGTALLVAGANLSLRQMRSHCRFERGEVLEAVSDLQHVLQIKKGDVAPHLVISAGMFYSMADMEKGLSQLAKCLQSDPDCKACSKLRKQEKRIEKTYKKMAELEGRKQFNSAAKLLVGEGEDPGLLAEIKEDVKSLKEDGTMHANNPDFLYAHLVEKACELYVEMNNKKRAGIYCAETLQYQENALPALINKAQQQLDADEFEPAINTLNQAKEHHGNSQKVNDLLQKAHTLLRRSRTKDYYKVLGVSRDADERTIKKAYRGLVKQYHPDKAESQGISKDEAEKKIVALNEAYEVLNDSEKRAQFDNGVDPNDPQQGPGGGNPFHGSPFGHGPGGQPIFFQSGGGGGGGGPFKFQQGGFHFNFA